MGSTSLNADDSEIRDSSNVSIPTSPLERVIGQPEAVKLAVVAAKQRRNLLLVGPPGIGKSMVAQALSFYIQRPQQEIRVVHNPQLPERPFFEIKTSEEILAEREESFSTEGYLSDPKQVPPSVAERLGYRCPKCGLYSAYTEAVCPHCSSQKSQQGPSQGPFGDVFNVIGAAFGVQNNQERVTSTRKVGDRSEIVVYERAGDLVRLLDERTLERRRKVEKKNPSKVIVPLERNPFVLATGASETELLGDVRHDPYGSHPQLGTLPYERVIAGSIHESHEGVLFIDEITHLGPLQRYILTAMQEKAFPISGRNPQSAGASVRVDRVPCDFILVAACNIQDLQSILSPLRSRILGNGYEVLMETSMQDTQPGRFKYMQFIAQEIAVDGRIPPMSVEAMVMVIEEGKRRARIVDKKENALTLRLREMGGLVRVSGDIAFIEGSKIIEPAHVTEALKLYLPVEEKIKKSYGNLQSAVSSESTLSQKPEEYFYTFTNNSEDPAYQ